MVGIHFHKFLAELVILINANLINLTLLNSALGFQLQLDYERRSALVQLSITHAIPVTSTGHRRIQSGIT